MRNQHSAAEKIKEISGTNPLKCMKCGKCSATCPSFDEMDIDGGTGNITVTSSQSLDGYMMDLDSGTGDITINGNDYNDEYEVNEHAKKHLVIDSGLGDIVVKY